MSIIYGCSLVSDTRKTNKEWYAWPPLGCYYKLEQGELHYCPALVSGERSVGDEANVDIRGVENMIAITQTILALEQLP